MKITQTIEVSTSDATVVLRIEIIRDAESTSTQVVLHPNEAAQLGQILIESSDRARKDVRDRLLRLRDEIAKEDEQ